VKHLITFSIVLLLLRIIFLLAALDPIDERVMEVLDTGGITWQNGPERPLFDREEQYTATGAEALRLDVGIPAAKLQFMSYGGGSRLVTELMVPVFARLGSNYLVFKLLPLLVSLLGGIFWWLVVRRWLGLPAAWLFGLLYIFAPSNFVRTIFIAKGDHSEAMMIAGAALLLATIAYQQKDERKRQLYALACGLVAGFGVHVTYSTVPVVFSILAAACLVARFKPLRLWLVGGAGLIVGLIPWLIRFLGSQSNPLQVYDRPVGSLVEPSVMAQRFQELIGNGFCAGYDIPGGAGVRTVVALVWMVFVIAGWLRLSRSIRKPFALLVLVGTVALLAAFCCTAPDASSRYLMPGYPLLMISASIAVVGIDGKFKWIGAAPMALVLLIGLAAQAVTLTQSDYRSLRTPFRGTDWVMLGEIAGQKLSADQLNALPAPVRPFFANGFGTAVFAASQPAQWPELVNLVKPELRPMVWEGIGLGVVQGSFLFQAGSVIQTLPEQDGRALLRGIARYADGVFAAMSSSEQTMDLSQVQQRIAGRYMSELDLTRARAIGVLQTQGISVQRGATTGLTPRQLHRGLGWALYRGFSDREIRLFEAPSHLPESFVFGDGADGALWQGIADGFSRDLEMIDPEWLIGTRLPCQPLAEKLIAITPSIPGAYLYLFYTAAGSACAKAWNDPLLVGSKNLSPQQWQWRETIPPQYHSAFQSGLLGTKTF
jgi:hypothetical protein